MQKWSWYFRLFCVYMNQLSVLIEYQKDMCNLFCVCPFCLLSTFEPSLVNLFAKNFTTVQPVPRILAMKGGHILNPGKCKDCFFTWYVKMRWDVEKVLLHISVASKNWYFFTEADVFENVDLEWRIQEDGLTWHHKECFRIVLLKMNFPIENKAWSLLILRCFMVKGDNLNKLDSICNICGLVLYNLLIKCFYSHVTFIHFLVYCQIRL